MIAVDTNILVYAHREDSAFYEAAARRIAELAEGAGLWAIPWPCIHEFLAVVTHPRIYGAPTPLARALEQVDAWLESPSLVLFAEAETHWPTLRALSSTGVLSALKSRMLVLLRFANKHGVRELWSADRDFGRFPNLTVVNPLVG